MFCIIPDNLHYSWPVSSSVPTCSGGSPTTTTLPFLTNTGVLSSMFTSHATAGGSGLLAVYAGVSVNECLGLCVNLASCGAAEHYVDSSTAGVLCSLFGSYSSGGSADSQTTTYALNTRTVPHLAIHYSGRCTA